MLQFKVVIPARFASTRLPGKPLLDIGGKPMVIRVAEQAAQSGAAQIVIATDHQPIIAAAKQNNFEACMTRVDHTSGTDRIAEVAAQQGWADDTIVVNVQGDEPLIPPALIRAVAQHLHEHPECAIATACHPIHDEAAMRNPNIVKAVLDKHGNALYFSRAPIPWPRDAYAANQPLPQSVNVLRHIGIYAYRASFLREFGDLAPAPIEQIESLEQLRALYHGYKIGVTITRDAPPSGVDTEQDLLSARALFNTHSKETK
ncbi:MAG: 3-deoxy-manno-octulosonate cytidylyltransferase (CMP-KDO synthetase) [Gallionellaceae bacterium]|nr:MAG: 3-deoxy-manno-octulosonate cytidylyltransferase (CMP-KDO synthetase) [Gallionellaceae bacterium]